MVPPVEHRYSKTFNYKWAPFRYRPGLIVDEPNAWLDAQPGLTNLTMSLHVMPGLAIRAVTLNCTAVAAPVRHRAQFDRVVLARGALLRNRKDLGAALNEWSDSHPDRWRVNYWTLSAHGVPTEVWILFSEPRQSSTSSRDTPPASTAQHDAD